MDDIPSQRLPGQPPLPIYEDDGNTNQESEAAEDTTNDGKDDSEWEETQTVVASEPDADPVAATAKN